MDPEAQIQMKEGREESQAATITWKDIRVTVLDVKGNEKIILNNVSGYVAPKRMLAIMGPSGSGKSTLLDTLAGRLNSSAKMGGQILLNGHKSQLSYGVSAFVTQDEMLVGSLSVRETFLYTALLRLPASLSYKDKVTRVDLLLHELGLAGAQHTKIGNWIIRGISGGQKRRVAIGCELIINPGILFLDEPTSGLDAAAAFFVMSSMRQLVEGNRTILSVIHQPSSEVFELFDHLCLLAGGQVMYFGPAAEALQMFEAAELGCPALRNPTDHFLHVINRDFAEREGADHEVDLNIEKLLAQYTQMLLPKVEAQIREYSNEGIVYVSRRDGPSAFYQTYILTERMFLNNLRNVAVFWLRLGMYLVLCICIGTVYYDLDHTWTATFQRAAAIFFTAGFLTFMSISGFPAFEEDMQVFVRERLNGYYGVATFAIANTIASAPFIFLIAISSSAVVYWLIQFNDSGDRFPLFFINLYVSLTVVESLMMAIAAVVPHYLMGIAGGAGIMGMFMLVCGFFQPVTQLPKPIWLYPMHFISFHSYSWAAFMDNEFSNTDGWDCPCTEQPGGCYGETTCTMTGEEVLSYYAVPGLNKWTNVGIQCAMILIYRVMFFMSLKVKEWLSRR